MLPTAWYFEKSFCIGTFPKVSIQLFIPIFIKASKLALTKPEQNCKIQLL